MRKMFCPVTPKGVIDKKLYNPVWGEKLRGIWDILGLNGFTMKGINDIFAFGRNIKLMHPAKKFHMFKVRRGYVANEFLEYTLWGEEILGEVVEIVLGQGEKLRKALLEIQTGQNKVSLKTVFARLPRIHGWRQTGTKNMS